MDIAGVYKRHFSDPRRERGFLSAVAFTSTFAAARAITHSIRAGIGPLRNISAGGTHVHHSALGILGLVGVGYAWTYRHGIGDPGERRWESRLAASAYGLCSALTLDEFALWLDLEDDYWNRRGRKSIDAVAIFAGLLAISVMGRGALKELGLLPKAIERFV